MKTENCLSSFWLHLLPFSLWLAIIVPLVWIKVELCYTINRLKEHNTTTRHNATQNHERTQNTPQQNSLHISN